MAQLNPNFEIDFDDINSYEQIQLINDTQTARENLLLQRAYKEPSDDEIIRNRFSSFTFVDFCPKIYTSEEITPNVLLSVVKSTESISSKPNPSIRCNELESFSEMFDRINNWLKLNQEWRVVSMQTLVYDFSSQFNHLKSSVRSTYLPENTRGLRLFLSPSKSRFSGPQKIGCINVVPRKVSGSHLKSLDDPPVYETLDDILSRLNELLLTRPIEGRILSIETLTLPVTNGFVNTESNFFSDLRLNIVNEVTYCPTSLNEPSSANLLDILRVYYEFGPVVCGLVNLIDFIPRFYSPTPIANCTPSDEANTQLSKSSKIPATESMTRLIRRSLAWFEHERKRILDETSGNAKNNGCKQVAVNLKMCNLQVCHRILSKSKLVQLEDGSRALELIKNRQMMHERLKFPETICSQCSTSKSSLDIRKDEDTWCPHMIELAQPYEVKFVRLIYVVPVYNKYARMYPLRLASTGQAIWIGSNASSSTSKSKDREQPNIVRAGSSQPTYSSETSSSTSNSLSSSSNNSDLPYSPVEGEQFEAKKLNETEEGPLPDEISKKDNDADKANEDEMKLAALEIVRRTTERHHEDELAHQLREPDNCFRNKPIGQLTYRLFAPCQLVRSSSCFSINPINSSSPLSRRGSVNLNSGSSTPTQMQQVGSVTSVPTTRAQQLLASKFALNHIQQVSNPFAGSLSTSGISDSSQDHLNATQTPNIISGYFFSQQKTSPTIISDSSQIVRNDFESVDAIRRRMEIYVTTNSMKVIAGETVIINLKDSLSCLSTAIEQAVVRRDFSDSNESNCSTWISVYILYAAVEEPQLPKHLLAQHQKLAPTSSPSKSLLQQQHTFNDRSKVVNEEKDDLKNKKEQESLSSQTCIRIEQNPLDDSSLILYNSAYDRTVALPTLPSTSKADGKISEFLSSYLDDIRWDDEDSVKKRPFQRRKYSRCKRKATRTISKQDESQCSLM